MIKFILIFLLIYLCWRVVRQDWQKSFRPTASSRFERADAAVDTIKCQRCGAYVAADTQSVCAHEDCPFALANARNDL